MNHRRLLPVLAAMLVLAGCAHGRVVNGAFVSDDYSFSVTLPGPPYEQIAPKGALVAMTDPATGASIAIAVSPDPYPDEADADKTLDFIARGLFFFLTDKEYRVFEDATLGGATARHVTLAGTEEDHKLIFSAYVARFSGRIYDLVMWCEPASFDEASAVFEKMAGTFTFKRGTGR
jgi:hypothetical protein